MSFTISELVSTAPSNPYVDALSVDFCLPFDSSGNLLLDSPDNAAVLFGQFSFPDNIKNRSVDSFAFISFPSDDFDSSIIPLLQKSSVGSSVLSDLPQFGNVLSIFTK